MAEKMVGMEVTFWVVFGVMILVMIVLVVLLIVSSVYVTNYADALYGAFFNTNTCDQVPTRCEFVFIEPPTPTEFPSSSFSFPLAFYCAQQVLNLEYFQQTQDLHLPAGLRLIGFIQTAEAGAPLFGYVAVDPVNRTAYEIFRGTETTEEWTFDFRFGQVPFSTSGLQLPQQEPVVTNWNCDPGCAVHDGFLTLFQQLQPRVRELTLSVLDVVDRVVVAGHSLGAAVSSLVATYVSADLTTKDTFVYTFGKPRVGNVCYASCLNRNLTDKFWRVENNDDLVPQIPISATPNVDDHGQPWLYQHEGNQVEYSTNWGSVVLNHSMNNYINFLLASNLSLSSFSDSTTMLYR